MTGKPKPPENPDDQNARVGCMASPEAISNLG